MFLPPSEEDVSLWYYYCMQYLAVKPVYIYIVLAGHYAYNYYYLIWQCCHPVSDLVFSIGVHFAYMI
jgi:hypothetical protein